MFEILICSSTVKAAVRTLLRGIRAGSSRVIDCGDVQMHSIGRAECLSLEVVRRKHSSATRKVKSKRGYTWMYLYRHTTHTWSIAYVSRYLYLDCMRRTYAHVHPQEGTEIGTCIYIYIHTHADMYLYAHIPTPHIST